MPSSRHSAGLYLLLLLLLASPLLAQEEQQVSSGGEPVRLYMDCRARGCDEEYIRTEIQFVNHVRDIRDSDVYLLATTLSTGAGGGSSELILEGRGRFTGMVDTLTYVSAFDATTYERRAGFTRLLKIGLMRFVGLTSLAEEIEIGLRPPILLERPGRPRTPGVAANPEDDPWDFWVFRVRGSGGLSGRTNYESKRFSGSFSANRTTEEWKFSLGLSSSYTEYRYDYPDIDYHRTNIRRSHTFSGEGVKALARHWSAGLNVSARNATYYNYDFAGSIAPVLEYSVFPYEEATRRSLTLQYAVEAAYYEYREQTIYFKDTESVFSHRLMVNLNFTRPWGSAFTAVSGGHHLDDVDFHNVGVFGGVNLRLGRGLTLTLSADVNRVQDQISVAAGAGSTIEEILLARKQLQIDYTYSTSISLSYTFGSIFNNVVNPRLGGGGAIGIPIIMY